MNLGQAKRKSSSNAPWASGLIGDVSDRLNEKNGRAHPPRAIFANWSPKRSFDVFAMLSSNRLGESALQIAKSAYIRSAVLLIYAPSASIRHWIPER